tara:strand:+ start:443 stop:631 length:189 start_codon:yes stop_codon:yes gene_type:complete
MKVVRLRKCECFFTYVEEFDTAEHALDPNKRGLFIKVKVGAIRVNSVSIRQKEDKYDEIKTA